MTAPLKGPPWSDFAGGAEDWDALLAAAGRSALEQSWAYGEAVARRHGWRPRRLTAGDPAAPTALAQILERPLLGPLAFARLLRGPVMRGADADLPGLYGGLRAAYRLRRGRALFWMPELPDGEASRATMRRCGLRRSVTGYTTAWLDLGRDEAALRAGLHGKWRNALVAAEAGGLEVVGPEDGDPDGLEWLLARHDEQRRARRFVAPDGLFYRLLAEAAGDTRACHYQARLEGAPLSAALFLRHGACATYAVGWSGAEGRRAKAQTLALWRGLLDLKRRGVRWLDLGGLTPAAPGVARFKLGLGAEPVRLAGTFF